MDETTGGREGDTRDFDSGSVVERELEPKLFSFVLDPEYFSGDCRAAAKTGCLSLISSDSSIP